MTRLMGMILVGALSVCLVGCSEAEMVSPIAKEVPSSSAVVAEEEVIYKDDSDINAFLIRYNSVHPDDPITADEVSKAYHHGSEHDGQIETWINDIEWTISSEGIDKVGVFFRSAKFGDAAINREVFGSIVQTFYPSLTENEIESLWGEVLDGKSKLSNGIEISKEPTTSDDEPGSYSYMKIIGPTPNS